MESCSSTAHVGANEQSAIDYDLSYRLDVLGLAGDEAEDQLDQNLMGQAKELGVNIDLSPQLKPLSTRTDSSDPTRRSESIYSTASQSTDLTEASREQGYPRSKRNSRASLSLRDYDLFLARGTTNDRRTSISFSQPSTPSNSVFSLPLHAPEASPKRHFRVRRGLSLLKRRSDSTSYASEGCPHCPQDPIGQWRAVHKVPCGHKLCKQALRETIRSAIASKIGAVPSCCGIPIPSNLIEHVITREEQSALLDKLGQWDEAISITPLDGGEGKDNMVIKRPTSGVRKRSSESKVDSVAPRIDNDVEKVQERSDFKQLQSDQAHSRDNFLSWIEKRHVELMLNHQRLRSEMKAYHQTAEDELFDQHGEAMADAEDKQVNAEADLREAHAQEKRDHATALKHMEAYCAGTYSTGEAHNRTITEQDRTELEKARRIRDGMDAKHESAINVLRGEQSRRMKMRQQRQDKEVQELRRSQRMKELELQRTCSAEIQTLNDFVADKQKKILTRWDLQNAIFAKQVEIETGIVLCEKLRSVEWPTEAVRVSENGNHGSSEEEMPMTLEVLEECRI